MLTRESLVEVMPRASSVADKVAPALDTAMERFGIDTPARSAAFLAQLAHESGQLQRWSENLGYRWQRLRAVFPKYFKSDVDAQAFDRQPERIANRVYANRMGNGPESSGDGWRYRGRGPIQLTGKDNYRACGADIGVDLVKEPERLETPEAGCLAAGWFWNKKGLNTLADQGDFESITRKINGGLNGQEEREAFWARAKAVLGVVAVLAGRSARRRGGPDAERERGSPRPLIARKRSSQRGKKRSTVRGLRAPRAAKKGAGGSKGRTPLAAKRAMRVTGRRPRP